MSTPRPAIWVETVTAPYAPASAMIAASSSSFLALSTTHGTPAALQAGGQPLGLLHVERADQHRPARLVRRG